MNMVHPPGFKYPRAPIAEATMAFGVEGLAPFDLERLGGVEVADYTQHDHTLQFESSAETGPAGVATKTSQRISGHRFSTGDGLQIALMTDTVFAFSRLAPYDTWDSFSEEGLRLWDTYASTAQPEVITRVGLRYVNQIIPPPGSIDLEVYLRTRPEVSDAMPQTTTGFYLSMDIPLPDYDAMCRLTQTIIGTHEGNALVLDIDVGQEGRYDPKDRTELRSVLDALRGAKNMVFEASITDTARELFT